jgi:hypothetical protein
LDIISEIENLACYVQQILMRYSQRCGPFGVE